MSRDDIVLIKKRGNKWCGWDMNTNQNFEEYSKNHAPDFIVSNLDEAITEAQKIPSEYGYKFLDL